SAPELALTLERRVQRWSGALHELGRDQEALDIAQKSANLYPNNAAIVRWLARIATISGRYDIAIPNYEALRSAGLPDADRFSAETDRFFSTVEKKVLSRIAKATNLATFQEAIHFAEAIAPYVEGPETLVNARERLVRKILAQYRELEKANAPASELATYLRLILSIDADHLLATRRLATLLTRNQQFVEAAGLWSRVVEMDKDDETARRHFDRCKIKASRMADTELPD
ncbi:MAG: hypothetical protein KDE63_09945, partial [Novosphingobium sp.]|nr:hypothetical protein [Novosphingobium sp.]